MRNVQLSVVAIPIGLLTTFSYDLAEVSAKGFFHGYNAIVWSVILLQALGGLLVAMVVRYADNILKVRLVSLIVLERFIIVQGGKRTEPLYRIRTYTNTNYNRTFFRSF